MSAATLPLTPGEHVIVDGPMVRSWAPVFTLTPSPPPLVIVMLRLIVPVQPWLRFTSAVSDDPVPCTTTPLTGPVHVYGTLTTGPVGTTTGGGGGGNG